MKFNHDIKALTKTACQTRLLLLDVDGILTDGRLYFYNSGEEIKAFNSLDGHGIKMLISAGVDVGIITGRTSEIIKKRSADLGITILLQGREDKLNALREMQSQVNYSDAEIAYAGDDFPDLPVLKTVGLSFSVPNGHIDIREAVHAVTESNGGMGAVREITDFILKAQNKYPQIK
ncbi:MAG TPA: phenylphosphate carboxylase subunit delta [Porticoccaceae bacterium]|jgi:3-deoxy-D-manno-octulosonate 8-phosphate phosphatase (KDO 8-P phosphatase)|nr:phenylphosphate carboxylase subunit delta [Gammaproteobacteria bacterium]HIL59165.1 phenylphosphate carboxylase subunit delta [Porticoccaceae bacterium]